MVDIVSDAGGVRTIRRVSENFRLHLPSYAIVPPSRGSGNSSEPDQDNERDGMIRVRLEVQEDRDSGALIYRLIDLRSGGLIREWRTDQIDDLRKFLQESGIQLLDKKI
ncbi:MAG TPA: hypothetical protein VLV55_00510 [Rhizomicrobium sp.]|nr:hypothetical protein [Rhizomicrobium sp.]